MGWLRVVLAGGVAVNILFFVNRTSPAIFSASVAAEVAEVAEVASAASARARGALASCGQCP